MLLKIELLALCYALFRCFFRAILFYSISQVLFGLGFLPPPPTFLVPSLFVIPFFLVNLLSCSCLMLPCQIVQRAGVNICHPRIPCDWPCLRCIFAVRTFGLLYTAISMLLRRTKLMVLLAHRMAATRRRNSVLLCI